MQVCEFESENQGVTPEMSMAPSPGSTFYVLPGVTEEYVNSGEGTQVYRVLGIPSRADELLTGSAGIGSITWENAQSVRSSTTFCALKLYIEFAFVDMLVVSP